MSNAAERLAQHGINIANPIGQVQKSLDERGVSIHYSTVSAMRRGCYSGVNITDRLARVEILASNDSSRKDSFYASFVGDALDSRTQQSSPNTHRYNSVGLTEYIATNGPFSSVNSSQSLAQDTLQAMRAELILTEQQGLPEFNPILESFNTATLAYLRDYHTGSRRLVPSKLNKLWDRNSITSFYGTIHKNIGAERLPSWVSYELEVFERLYETRLRNDSPLSPLDRLVLRNGISVGNLDETVNEIRERTSLPFKRRSVIHHENMLLFGVPRNPSYRSTST